MVYPVFRNKFRIGIAGRDSTEEDMREIKEMESFGITINGNSVEWSPMEQEGWLRRMVTGKDLEISMSGKRDYGDEGNDYVAEAAFKTGDGCESIFEWEMPSGAKLTMDCIINISDLGGGESTDVGTIEFDIQSDGKPSVTAAD